MHPLEVRSNLVTAPSAAVIGNPYCIHDDVPYDVRTREHTQEDEGGVD